MALFGSIYRWLWLRLPIAQPFYCMLRFDALHICSFLIRREEIVESKHLSLHGFDSQPANSLH